jgi:hypothetical protein
MTEAWSAGDFRRPCKFQNPMKNIMEMKFALRVHERFAHG